MLARFGGVLVRSRLRVLAAAGAGLGCLAAVAVSHAASVNAGVLKVRLGGDQTETRIVIDLDHSATAKIASDGAADRRVVMNLPGVSSEGLQGAGQGLVKGWVMDQTATGARLKVDLTADATIKRRFLLPPADGVKNYRYVIDLAAKAPPPSMAAKAGLRLTSGPLPSKAKPLALKTVRMLSRLRMASP